MVPFGCSPLRGKLLVGGGGGCPGLCVAATPRGCSPGMRGPFGDPAPCPGAGAELLLAWRDVLGGRAELGVGPTGAEPRSRRQLTARGARAEPRSGSSATRYPDEVWRILCFIIGQIIQNMLSCGLHWPYDRILKSSPKLN
ncbi:unnamed protein product [Caretta caretta]